jgi:hypothetical protein
VNEGLRSYRLCRWFFRTVYAWLLRVEAAVAGDGLVEGLSRQAALLAALARALPGRVRGVRDLSARTERDEEWLTRLAAGAVHAADAVVTVVGDGGFLFCAAEMATAVQHGIPTVTVLFDDGAYGNSNRDQRENYGGKEYGTLLRNPDWILLARSFGVDAVRVDDVGLLPGAVAEAPRAMAEEGRRLCAEGQLRVGIAWLRRAIRLASGLD